MNPVYRRRGDVEAMHASVTRERRQKAEVEGVVPVPIHRGGRARRAVVDYEPQPQVELEYDKMDVEHQVGDDYEAEEGVGDAEEDVDDVQQ